MITRDMIINAMLSTVGEGGVSTLNLQHPSVLTAFRIFEAEDLAFQTRGWWFNTELNMYLEPDIDGKVSVPADALKFKINTIQDKTPVEKLRYVKRGEFVYDTYLHTFVLNTGLRADVVLRLNIEDMPASAANYVKARAEERMYVDDDGDPVKTEKLERYRLEAWQMLRADEVQTMGTNGLDSPLSRSLRAGYNGGSVGSYIYGGGTR